MFAAVPGKVSLARVVVFILLLLAVSYLGITVGAYTSDSQSDLDVVNNFQVASNYGLIASCVILLALRARFAQQIELSETILLSFFFYSWRNSIHDKTYQIFPCLFSSL